MILIALGANLHSPRHGSPQETLIAAVGALGLAGVTVTAQSRWYETAPVPVSDQPWYVNGVVAVQCALGPAALLERLHGIEAAFGRVRGAVNAPRVLDLDLLAYDDLVSHDWPVIPHPRLQERAFVLLPLLDIAPDWRHPVSLRRARDYLTEVDPAQTTRVIGAKAHLT